MELKANELRIGNYLNTIHGIKRVSDISVDRYCWFTDNQCEPIPLTEEWLLKLPKDLKMKNIPKWIKYVHELQNWYYLKKKFKKELLFNL